MQMALEHPKHEKQQKKGKGIEQRLCMQVLRDPPPPNTHTECKTLGTIIHLPCVLERATWLSLCIVKRK